MKKTISFLIFSILFEQANYSGNIYQSSSKYSDQQSILKRPSRPLSLNIAPLTFNDHEPVWFVVAGADLLNEDIYLQKEIQTPKMDHPGYGVSGVSGGVFVGAGINTPLICFGDNSSIAISSHSAIACGDEYCSFKLPVYLNLHLGKGSTTYADADYILSVGAGYAFQELYYFDHFNYSFGQLSPVLMAEVGYKSYVLRVEYFINKHHGQFYDVSYADFQTFSIGTSFYFDKK